MVVDFEHRRDEKHDITGMSREEEQEQEDEKIARELKPLFLGRTGKV